MANDIYDSACWSFQRLKAHVENENYEAAESELKVLNGVFKRLDAIALSELSEDEVSYLKKLAEWLRDSNGEMKARSAELINTITPLNSNSVLKQRKQY